MIPVRQRSDVDRELATEQQVNSALDAMAAGPAFVKGTTLWHRVRETADDLSRVTVCSRRLPPEAPTRGWVAAVYLCNTCRSSS